MLADAEPGLNTSAAPLPPLAKAGMRRFGECWQAPAALPAHETWPRDAAVVMHFLAEYEARGAWQHAAPLTVIDLAPADGERAWQLLRVLRENIVGLRYLAMCASPGEAAALHVHPMLQALQQEGVLRVLTRPKRDTGWRKLIGPQANPVVIIAHGLLQTLRAELYACHYGEWMEARVDEAQPPALCWQPQQAPDASSQLFAPTYLQGANSAPVLLPTGAIACLEPLLYACRGRYLLIASDHGVSELAVIRRGALAVSADALTKRLPVNFHALSIWLASVGASSRSLDDGIAHGIVLQIAWRDARLQEHTCDLPDLCAAWREQGASGEALQALAGPLCRLINDSQAGLSQAVALWLSSDYAPRVMQALMPVLLAAATQLEGATLAMWREALRKTCMRHFPAAQDDGFLQAAAALAAALGNWGTAAALLETAAMHYGCSCDELRQRAYCLQRCGESQAALALLTQALQVLTDDAGLATAQAELAQGLARWDVLPWFAGDIARDGCLSLEPLGMEHAEPLFYQYRDPQIGMMTRLPELESLAAVCDWIAERQAEPCRADYALMHTEYGFVGALSAHWVGESAFIHFWLGTDFQGHGFAVPAIRMLCRQLAHCAMKHVFTTAYPDNFRSLRVLERTGFLALDEHALPPEEEMPFFGLELGAASHGAAPSLGAALREYCSRSGGVFAFAPEDDKRN